MPLHGRTTRSTPSLLSHSGPFTDAGVTAARLDKRRSYRESEAVSPDQEHAQPCPARSTDGRRLAGSAAAAVPTAVAVGAAEPAGRSSASEKRRVAAVVVVVPG
jgi:hypothetical protein